MNINKDVEEVLVSEEEIKEIAKRLGKQITVDYDGKKPLLIGLLKGSVPFMAELMKHIDCEMEIDFMDVKSYNGVTSTGTIRIVKDLNEDVKDRHILFIEDIIDTGLTLTEVTKMIALRKPASIEIVTLLDKPSGRKKDGIVPKYIGTVIPNKFVIGFGLDYDGIYRNLPYVGVLKRSVYEK